MRKLRDYQAEASMEAKNRLILRSNPKPFLLVMATGAGKSLVIADIAKDMDRPVLVLQPSRELVEQNYEKIMDYDPSFEVGIYCAGLKRKEIKHVTYATIHSVWRTPELFKDFHTVIIDECHQVDPKNMSGMYMTFLKEINCSRVCGLTATPYRLQTKADQTSELKMVNRIFPFFFKEIAYKIETQELIDRGFLSPILYRQVNLGGYDQLRLNTIGSEYTEDSVKQYWYNTEHLEGVANCIATVDAHCQQSLTFCANKAQALAVKEMLAEIGITAELVFGDTPAKIRAKLVADYKAGEFKHMLNVGVFTTGFDVPQLDCVILARNTMSLALYYQMVGRGVRLDPERPQKKLRVYDLVQISQKLGRVETIKIEKEVDPKTGKRTWKDEVRSEVGVLTNVPLERFKSEG